MAIKVNICQRECYLLINLNVFICYMYNKTLIIAAYRNIYCIHTTISQNKQSRHFLSVQKSA